MSLIPNAPPPPNAKNSVSVGQALEALNNGQFPKARNTAMKVLELMPENATAMCVKAHAEWRLDRDVHECIADVRKAFELAPDSPVIKKYLATMLISNGANDEASDLLKDVIEAQPQNYAAFNDLCSITKFTEETPLLKKMRDEFENPKLHTKKKEILGFALAKAYDDLKMPEVAAPILMEANELSKVEYRRQMHTSRLRDLRKLAASGKFEGIEDSGDTENPPIFVVGLPRSGTTLIETILSRHPDVFAAGELPYLGEGERRMHGYVAKKQMAEKAKPQDRAGPHTMLPMVDPELFKANAKAFREVVEKRAGHKVKRFVDKAPLNALRLPIMTLLFPTAKIVYARRHPLDTCISNLQQRFQNGLDFSFDQKTMGEFYHLVADTVEVSRKLIKAPVLDMSYDLLVQEPEEQIRRLVKFAGLEWNDACLTPEQSDRKTVMTASRWQVRQPIYKSSSAKWKRYEPYIGDMIKAIGGMKWVDSFMEETYELGRSDV